MAITYWIFFLKVYTFHQSYAVSSKNCEHLFPQEDLILGGGISDATVSSCLGCLNPRKWSFVPSGALPIIYLHTQVVVCFIANIFCTNSLGSTHIISLHTSIKISDVTLAFSVTCL